MIQNIYVRIMELTNYVELEQLCPCPLVGEFCSEKPAYLYIVMLFTVDKLWWYQNPYGSTNVMETNQKCLSTSVKNGQKFYQFKNSWDQIYNPHSFSICIFSDPSVLFAYWISPGNSIKIAIQPLSQWISIPRHVHTIFLCCCYK